MPKLWKPGETPRHRETPFGQRADTHRSCAQTNAPRCPMDASGRTRESLPSNTVAFLSTTRSPMKQVQAHKAAVGNRETQKSTTAAKLTYSGRASLLAPNNTGWEGLSLIPSSPQSKRSSLLAPNNTEWERKAERPSRIPSNSQEFQGQKVIPAAWKSLRES